MPVRGIDSYAAVSPLNDALGEAWALRGKAVNPYKACCLAGAQRACGSDSRGYVALWSVKLINPMFPRC